MFKLNVLRIKLTIEFMLIDKSKAKYQIRSHQSINKVKYMYMYRYQYIELNKGKIYGTSIKLLRKYHTCKYIPSKYFKDILTFQSISKFNIQYNYSGLYCSCRTVNKSEALRKSCKGSAQRL